jgi:hypothetical protein
MKQEHSLHTKRILSRFIPLKKNPLIHNKGTVNLQALKNCKILTKESIECWPPIVKQGSQLVAYDHLLSASNTFPTSKNKVYKSESCSCGAYFDLVQNRESLIYSLKIYLKLKDEIRIELDEQEQKEDASVDVHLKKMMEYKLETFTPVFKSLYAKDLLSHSSISSSNGLRKENFMLGITKCDSNDF